MRGMVIRMVIRKFRGARVRARKTHGGTLVKVKQISFDDEGTPESLVVSMTAREAAIIAQVIGGLSHAEANEIAQGGGESVSSIYDGLVGEFFNRFWEDGINDAIREL